MSSTGEVVRVFLSYAWENDSYRERVKRFAARLYESGIEARLDAWHLQGQTIPEFMSSETRQADKILVLCSPEYRRKVHAMEDGAKISGVGWEHMLLTSAIWTGDAQRSKIVPVLFEGDWNTSAPDFLVALDWLDIRDEALERNYRRLLQRLTGRTENAPQLGSLPPDLDPYPVEPLRGRLASNKTLGKTARPKPSIETTTASKISIGTWLPFVWFCLALSLVAVMIARSGNVIGFQLVDKIYYVALVALGLAAAGALFRGLRSMAHYRGKVLRGGLELGGPAVIFLLVVILGFWLPPQPMPFGLTVFVHGPGGPQDMTLRSQGNIAIDLGPDRRIEAIGDKGDAHFIVAAHFRGQLVPVSLQAEGFERADSGPRKLEADTMYLAVRRQPGIFFGQILDATGSPLAGGSVELEGRPALTDAQGRFSYAVPGDQVKQSMTLTVRAPGFQTQTHVVVAGSNEIRIRLGVAQ